MFDGYDRNLKAETNRRCQESGLGRNGVAVMSIGAPYYSGPAVA